MNGSFDLAKYISNRNAHIGPDGLNAADRRLKFVQMLIGEGINHNLGNDPFTLQVEIYSPNRDERVLSVVFSPNVVLFGIAETAYQHTIELVLDLKIWDIQRWSSLHDLLTYTRGIVELFRV